MSGWIKLHRDIRQNWIWQNPVYFRAWVDMIMQANHEPKNRLYKDNLVHIDRGQIVGSLKSFSKRWKMTINKTRHFLKLLENDSMIVKKTTQGFTHLNICNYDTYQSSAQTDHNFTTRSPHTHHTLTTTPKELKNEKNEKNVSKAQQIQKIKDNLDSFINKFPTKNVKHEFESFCDWLSAKGRTYKNYSAGFNNWLRKSPDIELDTKQQNSVYVCPDNHIERKIRRGVHAVCPDCRQKLIPKESALMSNILRT